MRSNSGPGRYHVSAEHLGYETLVSHLLEVEDAAGVYPVDLEMRPDPVAIADIIRWDNLPSITVSAVYGGVDRVTGHLRHFPGAF